MATCNMLHNPHWIDQANMIKPHTNLLPTTNNPIPENCGNDIHAHHPLVTIPAPNNSNWQCITCIQQKGDMAKPQYQKQPCNPPSSVTPHVSPQTTDKEGQKPISLMQHLPLDFTPTNSTPPAPNTDFTYHTNDNQLSALQQNPSKGISPTTSPMINGYHQSMNTTIQPPLDSKEGNLSSGKSPCNDSVVYVPLPWTTTNNTQNYQMPYSCASQYKNFCKTHDALEQHAGSIWHHQIWLYQTWNQNLQQNHIQWGTMEHLQCIQTWQLLPDGTIPTIHTMLSTLTKPSIDTDNTTALLPAITSWHQPLSPIAYDSGRPGPPWPLPTKFLHVHTPTASISTLTDLHQYSTATRTSHLPYYIAKVYKIKQPCLFLY